MPYTLWRPCALFSSYSQIISIHVHAEKLERFASNDWQRNRTVRENPASFLLMTCIFQAASGRSSGVVQDPGERGGMPRPLGPYRNVHEEFHVPTTHQIPDILRNDVHKSYKTLALRSPLEGNTSRIGLIRAFHDAIEGIQLFGKFCRNNS